MPKITFEVKSYRGKKSQKIYNLDTAILICKTPEGILYKKKAGTLEFFLYHPQEKKNKDKITMNVPWDKAANLCRSYAPRDVYENLFTLRNKSTNKHSGPHQCVVLDDRTRVMAMRNASMRGMNVTQFIRYLIQNYDDYHYYHKTKGTDSNPMQ